MKKLVNTRQAKGKTVEKMKIIDGDDDGQWCKIWFTDNSVITVTLDYPPDRTCSIMAVER